MREHWQRLQNFFDEICTRRRQQRAVSHSRQAERAAKSSARSWLLLWMVIRKRRPLVLLRRILAQLLHQNRDGLFKCGSWPWRIACGSCSTSISAQPRNSQLPTIPRIVKTTDGQPRTHRPSTMDSRPVRHQSTPGSFADKRPDLRFSKINGIASPPEPAYSSMIIAFGPKIAASGDGTSCPCRITRNAINCRSDSR